MEPLLLIVVLIASVVVHEVAHAWQARREGDPTAEREGRITLNPLPHIDPVGSVIVPAALYLSGTSFLFGWAKPVPVNPAHYRDPKWGDIRVSLAGVASNFVLALLATLATVVVVRLQPVLGAGLSEGLLLAARYGILINLVLAFFNLIPIPPLDGSHVLFHFLPRPLALKYREAGRYGLLVVMGLLFLVPGAFQVVFWPVTVLMGAADTFIRLWI
jgi:Zn-dependent protease